MFGKKKTEVLVVGAGPVGLFAGLALAKAGIDVTIVDREWRTGAHSYALALHARSLQLLDEFGLLDEVLSSARHVRTVGLYDETARRSEMRVAGGEETDLPVAVMRQDVLERALEKALRDAGVKVHWNHEVNRLATSGQGAVASVDKLVKESVGYASARTEWMIAKSYDLEARFVVGADGHQSTVRRSLGYDFPDLGGTRHFAVFEFETDADLGQELRVVMGPETTDVLWPLPDSACRWSFELVDSAAPAASRTKNRLPIDIGGAQYMSLDEEFLRRSVAQRAPWFEGQIGKINWRIMVRFERRLTDGFGRDATWLAGDAGHLTGPVGMQSMNVGLREAKQLCDIMTGVLRNGAAADQLQEYDRQRRDEWRCLLGLEGDLVAQDSSDPWLQRCGQRLLSCIPASGTELAAMADQVGLKIPMAIS